MSTNPISKDAIIQKAWEDEAFKKQLMSNPKAALKEAFGIVIPSHIHIKTVEETTNEFVLVIPENPALVLVGAASAEDVW